MGLGWQGGHGWGDDPAPAQPARPAAPFLELRGPVAGHALDLDIHEQELFCILGPPRCGKTALMRAIAGLDPPPAGSIRLSGRPEGLEPGQVGFVAEENSLFPWLSVRRNVQLPLRLDRRRRADPWRADALLGMAGLLEVAHGLPQDLPLAVRGAVAVCRALARDPAIVLIDEPFRRLDPADRRAFGDVLVRLRANSRRTFVLFTSDAAAAVHVADRLAVLRPGHPSAVVDVPLPHPRAPAAEAPYLARALAPGAS